MPTLVNTWGHWLETYPHAVAYQMFDNYVPTELPDKPNEGGWLNEMLATGLRPTLFLAQLPNLFAGNISIVHGVSGSSRTFMGEESAGVDAVRIAWEKITAGQGDLFLVGGAFSADRPEMLLMFEPYGLLRETPVPDLWHRPPAGMTLGSVDCWTLNA